MTTKIEFIEAHIAWLGAYKWDWFGTLTFPGYPSVKKAKRKLGQFLLEIKREVGGKNFRYVSATERGSYNDNVHFHVLIGGIRKEHKSWPHRWKCRWQEIAGQAVLNPFDANIGGLPYLLKSLWPDRDFDLDIKLPKVKASKRA